MESINSKPTEPLLLSLFLKSRKVKEVERESRVQLDGVNIESYSGYITVDERLDKNLFFWFFPAAKIEPKDAPLVLYLNGGPGYSSLVGLFAEIGPFTVDKDLNIQMADFPWTDTFNVLFVDNPVFVGFSYAKPGHEPKDMNTISDDLYSFLMQFFKLYPKYEGCDFYIGGQSYAGKYVVSLASKIHSQLEGQDSEISFTLKGIYIFSGFLEPFQMLQSYPHLLLSLGMISQTRAQRLGEAITCGIHKHGMQDNQEEATKDILEAVFTQIQNITGFETLNCALYTKDYDWHFEKYLNKPEVQHAIHARASEFSMNSLGTIMHMAEDFGKGVSSELKSLLEHYKFFVNNVRKVSIIKALVCPQVLLVSGQMDILVSVPMIENFLHSLNWSGESQYLAADKVVWKAADREVAGYVTEVKNLTRVVVRNAGHRIAFDQPKWTLEMMTKFVNDQSFVH
ncbi:carboxypeptidase [Plakobranchus ocellatus]|uniref:Carboxypeptidase n=1 Tax=Plakobranchus ocellatus TaxID=259542 RepID=A0AAV4DMR7_9GAST|nr:carboxypeptidase [Plakobranchus ocellatus]